MIRLALFRPVMFLAFTVPCYAQIATNTGLTGMVTADSFPGSDIGAKINTAFASASGTAATPARGVVVNLSPDKIYRYATTIVIPHLSSAPYIAAPVLDCHNAVLEWSGTSPNSDQLTVLGENDLKSGEIRNCRFTSSNPSSTITFWSRIDFSVSHSFFGVPVRFINDFAHGGPGYTEENHWDDIELNVAPGKCGVSFQQDATIITRNVGSFFYNWFSRIHLSLEGGANGFCLRAHPSVPPLIQGGSFDIHVNASANAITSVFYLEDGTGIIRGVVNINGENAAGRDNSYDVYAATPSATFYNFGSSNALFPHGYGPGVALSNIVFIGPQVIANDLGSTLHGTRTFSGEPGGTIPQRQCENQQIGNVTAFLMPAYGSENNCFWEVAYRITDDANKDVDRAGNSGHPITTRIWTSSQTGVGFGPNYGAAKGNIQPRPGIAIETSGGLGITTPTPKGAGIGAHFQTSIDPTTGTLAELYYGGSLAGQPSYQRREDFFDFTDGKVHTGLTRYAAGGVIHYALPTLKLGSGPELTGVQGSTGAKLAAATGSFTQGDPITTDANGNLVDAGAAFTGTRKAGACTFTIVKGLITTVSGC